MSDRDIDDILNRAAGSSANVDPKLLQGIVNAVGADLQPVRPLPSSRALTIILAAICAAVGIAGAAILGLQGIAVLSGAQMALIFPVLLILIALAAAASVGEMIPGSRRLASPAILLAIGCVALTVIFGILFTAYREEDFVNQGLRCLKAGLLHAIPTAAAAWWVLRRGFAVNGPAAGIAVGSLAGMAGLGMLELHCPNLEAAHVMVWHTGVLALGGLLGGLLAVVCGRRR